MPTKRQADTAFTNPRRRYYTLDEANAEVVAIRRCFDVIMQLRTQAKILHDRLEASGYPASIDDEGQVRISSSDGSDLDLEPPPASVLSWAGMLRASYAALHEQILEIEATGAVIRDLEDGAVDWLALHEGQEISWCWRYGEIEIGRWLDRHRATEVPRPLSELSKDG